MDNVVFYSVKGGAGVTVTAAATAINLANMGVDTLFVSFCGDDVFGVLGMSNPSDPLDYSPREAAKNLRVMMVDPRAAHPADGAWQLPFAEVYVFEAPAEYVRSVAHRWSASSVLVTRSCYLALRRAVAATVTPDRVVLVQESGRSLRADDIAAVVGREVSTIPYDSAVARAVDAGLLLSRLPRVLTAVQAA